jgi:endonuclease YncB( thermonuclease family)
VTVTFTGARHRARVISLVGVFMALVGQPVVRGADATPVELQGYVRAIQGDTLDARLFNRRIGIGIVGIQAPPGNTPCGKEATAFVQGLVNDGAMVEAEAGLASEPSRRLYHVSTLDGRSVAEAVVTAGLARADGQGRNRDRLTELEAAARDARQGCLWRRDGAP